MTEQGSFDVAGYFDGLKGELRELQLVPAVGRLMVEAKRVEEWPLEIGEGQVRAQSREWETEVDVAWVRQFYRRHGWPDAFRRKEAMKAVKKMLESWPPE